MRKEHLNKIFHEKNLNAIFSSSPQTRLWYTGVATSDGFLIIEQNKASLFVDSRYIEYCQNNAKNAEVFLLGENVLKNFFQERNFSKIGIEEEYITYKDFEKLKSLSPNSLFEPINSQKLRILKDDQEIEIMQKAIDISLDAFEKIKKFLIEGVSEKEIASKFDYLMKRMGAEKTGFDSIVAFGASAAEPHHHPTDNKLKKGDIVKLDFGALYLGYCADITRTFFYDDEIQHQDPKLKEILEIVEEAARLGRESVRPGISTLEIDNICRQYIASKGYLNFFLHSTGHGLGIDVHELPNVSKASDVILEPGMVITVEPGIYIKGLGGARIEDDILVTETGHRVLSRKE
ncbi:MAG: aminopeptidase P family protein [Metamycoplasmataceae bacterium]